MIRGGEHSHDHGHASGHAHAMPIEGVNLRMGIAVALNLIFVVIEGGFGFLSNSVALIADAGHNLSDVLGLVCAWGALLLGRRPPGAKFTYGLGRSSVLAALVNAVLLLLACGAIAWEAASRLAAPPPVAGRTVMAVAAIGIVLNGISAWMLHAGSHGDLNRRSAYLHMLGDAAVSGGVLLSGLLIVFTGWSLLDPIVSLVIVAVILVSTWRLLRGLADVVFGRRARQRQFLGRHVLLGRSARRDRRARSAHLGAEHDQRRTDRAPGRAGPRRGRRAPDLADAGFKTPLSNPACHAADRKRSLRARL